MKSNNSSLLLKEQTENETAPFFPDFDLPEIDKAKPKFHCTGERLFRDRPDIYKAVVQLVAEPGVSVRTICRECHVSDHTVRSVAEREKIPIATVKKQVLSNITHGLRLASERVIELMPEASTRDALIGVGILGEKMQLLSDEPTMRIDLSPSPNHAKLLEAIDRMHAQLLQARELRQGDVIELPAVQTGVDGGNIEPKALENGEHERVPIESATDASEPI